MVTVLVMLGVWVIMTLIIIHEYLTKSNEPVIDEHLTAASHIDPASPMISVDVITACPPYTAVNRRWSSFSNHHSPLLVPEHSAMPCHVRAISVSCL